MNIICSGSFVAGASSRMLAGRAVGGAITSAAEAEADAVARREKLHSKLRAQSFPADSNRKVRTVWMVMVHRNGNCVGLVSFRYFLSKYIICNTRLLAETGSSGTNESKST